MLKKIIPLALLCLLLSCCEQYLQYIHRPNIPA